MSDVSYTWFFKKSLGIDMAWNTFFFVFKKFGIYSCVYNDGGNPNDKSVMFEKKTLKQYA